MEPVVMVVTAVPLLPSTVETIRWPARLAPAPSPMFPPHPRRLGWVGTTALAMGGSNQMLFIVGALLIGQGDIPGQGTAAIPLLMLGLVLSWLAAPGWTELALMWPDRVGGLAATCGEAFRPYAPVLGNLAGVCYWWGWVPTCGVTALLSASAIHQWFFPWAPVPLLACGIVATFTLVNLCGVWWPARVAIPLATISAALAFLSATIPIFSGSVDWLQATSFQLTAPFPGWFGQITSVMAGLYLVGFAAPAFEASLCHVGETLDPAKNVPRAVAASALMATLYFCVLPMVWLGTIGAGPLAGDLATTLGPTFAPLFGGAAKSAAIWFMVFNMFHGTLAPLTGVARTLSQLSEDGLLPRFFALRNRFDCPWVAISLTAVSAIAFLLAGDPIWLIAAADFTYLIGISLPSVAVWLLRRDRPELPRPYRAPRGFITLGLVSACVWGLSTVLGFEQFGLPTVIFGLALAYSGAALYAMRKYADARAEGRRGFAHSLHVKLTGAMLLVLVLDGAGYLLAVTSARGADPALVAGLEDIFVAVAILTITVGLVLPGMIAHSAEQVSGAARRLAVGTLHDFSGAMEALGAGDLEGAQVRIDLEPVAVTSRDELGEMAASFNIMQAEVERAARGLLGAREGLRSARDALQQNNLLLEQRVQQRTAELEEAHRRVVQLARQAGRAEVAAGVLHNVGNVLNSLNVSATIVQEAVRESKLPSLGRAVALLEGRAEDVALFLTTDTKGRQLPEYLARLTEHLGAEQREVATELAALAKNVEHVRQIISDQQVYTEASRRPAEAVDMVALLEDAVTMNQAALDECGVRTVREYESIELVEMDKHRVLQILVNLVSNACHAMMGRGDGAGTLVLRVGADPASRSVRFEVGDDGIGIAPEVLPHIFEHGFTTRPDGHGLGLHSAALAARLVGGSLVAHSEGQGSGATFSLLLPRLSAVVGA